MAKRQVNWTLLASAVLLALVASGCGGGSSSTGPRGNGTIRGVVRDDLGQPLAGAAVAVGTITATSDAAGAFTLAAVPAGGRTVTATRTGYADGTARVTVVAGQTVRATITLRRANNAPTVTLRTSRATLPFTGGSATLSLSARDADGDRLTATLTGPGGVVPLTAGTTAGTWRATVRLDGNSGVVGREEVYLATVSDRRDTTTAAVTITVEGVKVPEDVGGGKYPDDGPPVPSM